jgi:hypothetical protein
LKHNHKVTTTWQAVLDHRQHHQGNHAEEIADARQYWTERKAVLGITEQTPHELALERIATARPPRQRSARALEHAALGIERHITELEQHHGKLASAQALEQAYARRGRQVPERSAQQHEALVLEGQALGISRAPHPSPHLLQDREQARARQAQRERPAPTLSRVEGLVHELSHEDAPTGQGVRVRLFDREREDERGRSRDDDRGMGW